MTAETGRRCKPPASCWLAHTGLLEGAAGGPLLPMKALLLFPPSWTPSMPHLATPMLTAYLRAQGVEVAQHDLNLEVMDRLLTAEQVRAAQRRVRRRFRSRAAGRHARQPRPDEAAIDWALGIGEQLAETVDDAKAVFRSPALWDGPRGRAALETLVGSLQLIALPFYPGSIELSANSAPLPEDSSSNVLRLARGPQTNVFYQVLDAIVADTLLAENADLVGISIPTMGQLVAGLTVAHLLRARGCRAHITVGGPHITMLREQLVGAPALFDLIDSAVVFDGERPLGELVRALEKGAGLAGVPNLIYRDGGRVVANALAPAVPLAELPTPDFGGLPLGRYLIPEPVLPLISSRGCYHGRCAFCSVGYGGERRVEALTPEATVERMVALQERYGARHVWFADEAISPRNLSGMAGLLEERAAPLHWGAYGRLDRAIDATLLQSLGRAGCRMLFYGLETASPPIVTAMRKGTTIAEMDRVLREGAAAGIWNHVFFFFGFPGETMEDAQETVNFLYAHADCIHSAAYGTFMLERHSPAHQHPEEFGIEEVLEGPQQDLAITFGYRVGRGLDEAMAEQVAGRLMDVLPRKEFPQLYVHDTYRLLYAARLHEAGSPFPTWLGD